MRSENVPTPANPESPPLAPYDPPEPAPQAAAWRRALKVIGCLPGRHSRLGNPTAVVVTVNGTSISPPGLVAGQPYDLRFA